MSIAVILNFLVTTNVRSTDVVRLTDVTLNAEAAILDAKITANAMAL